MWDKFDYPWPEPIALQANIDPNQTVRLHCLCTVCQRLVDEFEKLVMDEDPKHQWPDCLLFPDDHSTEYKHHRSSLDLAASSEGGCHLCSILWARLQAETPILESLRLLESHLQATFMKFLDMVPHSYAITVSSDLFIGNKALILYYPPKHHEFGESEELCSLIRSSFMDRDPTYIAVIVIQETPCLCIPFIVRHAP